MATRRTVNRSFAGGTMSPEMFGRIDDVKFQNGAARLRNFLVKPQGPAFRRPGFGYVNESPDSDNRVRLMPFRFNAEQSFCLELGRRADLDGRSIGYIRLHTEGQTLQYATPRAYVEPQDATALNLNTETWTFGAAHGYQTGDPVVLTTTHLLPAPLAEFTIYYAIVPGATTLKLAATHADALADNPIGLGGSECTFDNVSNLVERVLHGYQTDERVTFAAGGGALPVEIVAGTTYFVRAGAGLNSFEISATLGGPVLNFSAGGPGAVELIDARFHFAYEPADLVEWSGAGAGNFYCMGRPWTTHADHAPTDTIYWYREPDDLTYEVPHFYSDAALFEITYVQSNDVLTLCHRDRQVAELRRLGETRWLVSNVTTSSAAIAAPTGVSVASFRGAGHTAAGVTAAAQAVIGTNTEHGLAHREPVHVEAGIGSIPAGFYLARTSGLTAFELTLVDVETGNDVASGSAVVTGAPRIRPTLIASDNSQDYVVTALTASGEESVQSSTVTATNNLLASGAYNTVSWAAVSGATRYRVYKKQTGLFGYIGEVDAALATSFKDDNIAPDLGITPPITDSSLLTSATVTFDVGNDRVNYTAHGRAAGDPVAFSTDGTLPDNVTLGETYYVLDPKPNSFQISATPHGAAIDIQTGGMAGVHSASTGHFPGAVGYFEQRRVFAGAHTAPQRVWMTRSGTESDLSYHLPVLDDDRIKADIASREGNVIRHVVPLGHLLLLTSEGEYRVSPVNSDAITPDSFSSRAERYVGCSTVRPEVVNGSVVFCAARGGHVYEGGFVQGSAFQAGDVSLRAAHLFDGETIAQLAHGHAPVPVVWFVSTSGKLLGLTYVPEESVGAWHEHDTDGDFESCCVVPEGDEDRLYVVVRRTIDGATVRYVERLGAQRFEAIEDCTFLDSHLTFDGTNTAATTITPSLGGAYQVGGTVTLTASVATFAFPAQTDVGDEIRLTGADGTVYAIEITATTSTTVAAGKLLKALPSALQSVASTTWAWARDSFAGLDHLEGEDVVVLADGEVVEDLTVESGAIALEEPAVLVHIGLPLTAEIETLPVIMQVDGWGQGRQLSIGSVGVRVFDSDAGFMLGPVEEDASKQAAALVPADPAAEGLLSKLVNVNVSRKWEDGAQLLIRQEAPLPLTVTSLVLEVSVGG